MPYKINNCIVLLCFTDQNTNKTMTKIIKHIKIIKRLVNRYKTILPLRNPSRAVYIIYFLSFRAYDVFTF